MQQIKQQTSSDKMWYDESGNPCPYSRTTHYERKAERAAARLAKGALSCNKSLSDFKDTILEAVDELYNAFLEENEATPGKGNFTIYNFDRSIKIEVDVNDIITFDDNLIGAAKAKLDEFIDSSVEGVESFIKDLVMSAFSTSRGKMDVKKVLSLRRHASKINDERYHEAMALIDKAIRKPHTKQYFRISIKNEEGSYQQVNLNFATI